MNTTSSELVANAGEKQTLCIPMQRELIEQRVAQFLDACYAGKGNSLLPVGGVLIPMKGFVVHKELVADSSRFSVRSGEYYSMTVDVATQPLACGTTLNVYAVTSFWTKKMAGVISAARGAPPSECP